MNDFTKEELEEIQSCLKYVINSGVAPFSSLTMELRRNIKNKIQHYCDCKEFYKADIEVHACCRCGKYQGVLL